ncbi:hypothetical protein [Paracoccus sp. ME4]|uniref:hypothetical protein n=1 Tax=Paracoccus sp. ME4 TaxID=3138066 RepID=UPI00398B61E2
MSEPEIFDLALGAEVRAARIEAALDADPRLGQQWRAEVGIAEAVCSVGLEDVRISAPGLLQRIVRNRIGELDTSAAENALAILRFIRSPFSGQGGGAGCMERVMRFCPSPGSGEAPWPGPEELAGVFEHCRGRAPILEALRASGTFGLMTERRSPVAERLVFMAAEHLSRSKSAQAVGPRRDDPLRGLGGRYDASWIIPPALSLIADGFRIWSPVGHARALIEGIDRQLGREIGRIGTVRRWVSEADRVSQARHGRSRIHDAVRAFTIEPLMSIPQLAERIAVTERGALNLMLAMREQGLVVELTRRRSSRYWATPALASMLVDADPGAVDTGGRRRSAPASRVGDRPDERGGIKPGGPVDLKRAHPPRALKAEAEESMSRAMESFDRALDEADAILSRIHMKTKPQDR